VHLAEVATPALIVDPAAFEHNVSVMSERWPGVSLRPHVKAFKSTALAARLADQGHTGFCCATIREMEGMAAAGLGHDLLLANEVLDTRRLGLLVASGAGRVTVAVDSDETVDAAAAGGVRAVLIDVNVGLPRCGCDPTDAARLAKRARTAGLEVRGVMGYEGHAVGLADRSDRAAQTEQSMVVLRQAHEAVGGDIVSGGGTGTWDINEWITELQAGSFTLMDTAYAALGMPFRQAVYVLGTVISVNAISGFAVADVGLKSLGMDHGNPSIDDATVWFCSDEHITFAPPKGTAFADWGVRVGQRVAVWPAHIDPTIAMHDRMHVIESAGDDGGRVVVDPDAEIIDTWLVDLRNW